MLTRIMIAGATLVALGLPGFAAVPRLSEPKAPHAEWTVIQNVSDHVCYAADRKAGPGEARVGGAYASESAATMSIDRIAACDGNAQDSDNG